MLTAILLRNIKNYSNINFIPICSYESKYSIYVGNNGVGKSAILEAINVFFNEKEWNISISQKKTEAYICPIFLIKKTDVRGSLKELYTIVSDSLWETTVDFNTDAIKQFLRFRDKLKPDYEQDYFLVMIGIGYDNYKIPYFSSFDSLLRKVLKEKKGIDDEAITGEYGKILNDVRNRYSYIYVPVEESPDELLKLQNYTMQKMLNTDLLSEIEKVLNEKTKQKNTIISQINNSLDEFVEKINSIIITIDDRYSFSSDYYKRGSLTAKDLRNKVLEAYFPLRTLKVEKKKVSQLSSGEQRKAIIDIAYAILAANEKKATEKEIILAIDEPENSMHVSNCFNQFLRLEELASKFGKQVIITTHWYGFLPIAQDGDMHYITDNDGGEKIRSFSLYNYTEQRREYPDVIELKSLYDLATALITYMRHGNCENWIICEGSDDKIYLEHIIDNSKYKILPVGGCGNVVKLFQLVYEPLSDKTENPMSNILFLTDTDEKFTYISAPNELGGKLKKRHVFLRRLQREDDQIRLVDPLKSNYFTQTEIEDCLNPKIYYKTLVELINDGQDEELKRIVNNFNINSGARLSRIKGDDACISPLDIQYINKKSLIISFAEDKNNKKRIAKKYVELCDYYKEEFVYDLKIEIERVFGKKESDEGN